MKLEKSLFLNDYFQADQEINNSYFENSTTSVSANSSDLELANEYAPQILLSDGFYPGVDIKDANYPYTDYIPIYVNNVTKRDRKTVDLNLAEAVTYKGVTYGPGNVRLGHLDYIGDPVFRSSDNYLDFSYAWFGTTIENGYKALTLYPTVNFRVFREPTQENPIAVQYWFFYYYNDWFNDHPDDWETMTVFLDANAQPVQAIFSTHYEALKYSWFNVETVNNTHPKVYVSNGGHGSYNRSGNTWYKVIRDNHEGNKEVLNPADYFLLDLKVKEEISTNDNWIWFEGRWGDEDEAPRGPHFRKDAPTTTDWDRANHGPYNPEANCAKRYGANIYGISIRPGPWFWASGYGLDHPWNSASDCRGYESFLTSIIMLLLFN